MELLAFLDSAFFFCGKYSSRCYKSAVAIGAAFHVWFCCCLQSSNIVSFPKTCGRAEITPDGSFCFIDNRCVVHHRSLNTSEFFLLALEHSDERSPPPPQHCTVIPEQALLLASQTVASRMISKLLHVAHTRLDVRVMEALAMQSMHN